MNVKSSLWASSLASCTARPLSSGKPVLEVPGMASAACPIVVKKAITRVDGVSKAEVDFGTRRAIVTYDDARASLDQIMPATADAGYPATRIGAGK